MAHSKHLPATRARASLSKFLVPLFDYVSDYTGLPNMAMVIGKPPSTVGGQCLVAAFSRGETKEIVPRNFMDFNPTGFHDNFLGEFARFLYATSGEYTLGSHRGGCTLTRDLKTYRRIPACST